MGYLLGLGRIPKNPAGHAVHRADQPVVHRLKRFLVATRYVDEQVIEVPLSPPIVVADLNRDASESLGFI